MNQLFKSLILLFFCHLPNKASEDLLHKDSKNIIDTKTQTIKNNFINNFVEWKEYPAQRSNIQANKKNNDIYNYCRFSSPTTAAPSGAIVQLYNVMPQTINTSKEKVENFSFPLEPFKIILQYLGYTPYAQTIEFLNIEFLNKDQFDKVRQAGIFAKPTWFSMNGTIVEPKSSDKFLLFLELKSIYIREHRINGFFISPVFSVNIDIFNTPPEKKFIKEKALCALKKAGIISSFNFNSKYFDYDSTAKQIIVPFLEKNNLPFFNLFNNEQYSLLVEKDSTYLREIKKHLTISTIKLHTRSLNLKDAPQIINTFEFKDDFVRNCFYANNLVIIELIDDHMYYEDRFYNTTQKYHLDNFPNPKHHRIAFYSIKTKKLLLSIKLPLPDEYKLDSVYYSLEYADKECIYLYDWIEKRYISFNYIFGTFENLININPEQKKQTDTNEIISHDLQEIPLQEKNLLIDELVSEDIHPQEEQKETLNYNKSDPLDTQSSEKALVINPVQIDSENDLTVKQDLITKENQEQKIIIREESTGQQKTSSNDSIRVPEQQPTESFLNKKKIDARSQDHDNKKTSHQPKGSISCLKKFMNFIQSHYKIASLFLIPLISLLCLKYYVKKFTPQERILIQSFL